MKKPPDRRLNAYCPDRADIALKGIVPAAEYVASSPAKVIASVIDLKAEPKAEAEAGSQLLLGEAVAVFEVAEGWSWSRQTATAMSAICPRRHSARPPNPPTHVVAVPRTLICTRPDLRSPVFMAYSMGSRLTVVEMA